MAKIRLTQEGPTYWQIRREMLRHRYSTLVRKIRKLGGSVNWESLDGKVGAFSGGYAVGILRTKTGKVVAKFFEDQGKLVTYDRNGNEKSIEPKVRRFL